MKKVFVTFSFVLLLMISFLGITYSYEYSDNLMLKFELIGGYYIDLNLGEQYNELGVNVYYGDSNLSSFVNIYSDLDTNKVGIYKIKYEIVFNEVKEYIYRIIRVTEKVKPEIYLKGEETMYVEFNGNYVEPGYIVEDNYDDNLEDKVEIINGVDVTKKGKYIIEYRVRDSSGNESSKIRTVIVE